MGINGLNDFLRKKCPTVFKKIHISEYAYKKVAIDISLYMCRFKVKGNFMPYYGKNAWLVLFLQLIACLRRNEIHCVFVYDSGACVPEKEIERKRRRDQREKQRKRIFDLQTAVDTFNETGEINQVLVDFQKRRKIKPPRMLGANKTGINIERIEYEVKKMTNQDFDLTIDDFNLTKKLFDILDIPYIDAPLEAETWCADLCKQGIVDAVLSEDTDVIAYASPYFLTGIDVKTDTCNRIEYKDILNQLEMTSDQFLDLCIMSGTDYNDRIFRIGPIKAYKLLQTHSRLEEIEEKTKHDTSVLNYKRVRELFRDYERFSGKVSYCGTPDYTKLVMLLEKKNLKIGDDFWRMMKKAFSNEIIIINDDGEEIEENITE